MMYFLSYLCFKQDVNQVIVRVPLLLIIVRLCSFTYWHGHKTSAHVGILSRNKGSKYIVILLICFGKYSIISYMLYVQEKNEEVRFDVANRFVLNEK